MTADTYADVRNAPDFVISIGDGATPEVFTPMCTINKNRSLDLTTQIAESMVPNCTNPNAPAKKRKRIVALDWSVSGDGALNSADALVFANWQMSGAIKNIKVSVGSTTGDLLYTGPAICEQFTLSGAGLGELVQAAVKLTAADGGTAAAHT